MTVFLITTILVGLLLIPSFLAAFGEDEGTLRPDDTFWNFFALLFHIIRFPTHTLLWPIITSGGPLTFFGGLFINCMFYGLVVERITSLFRKKKENNLDTIDEKSNT
ncbi:hypothetical protein [Pedobacter frigiditerrae]|uniref:hypothetical protein n=1 Tax=Pedobacter frigiditerrae TaxID=2530452 RepID=UPI00292FA8CB|nr:hypothetical protein [Pedobacter frigiditerrae]